ncbi:MAG TPA: alpha/beta hydrolase domain-containing protein [Alphaproteobacteria bacterium]|nr:alpha/beta hydrolase domain-containing protein [Alphaproteobacteria bacterium]
MNGAIHIVPMLTMAALILAAAPSGAVGAEAAAMPLVSGPVTGGARGQPKTAAAMDIAQQGYVEQEFFVEGMARSFAPKGGAALSSDGLWEVTPGERHHYKTRMLVRRPVDPARFNGTVVVEWLQSHPGAAFDKDVYWIWTRAEILRDGFAWVGVSADRNAVGGHPPDSQDPYPDLVRWDPQRYGTLDIPDEDIGYDIFTEVARLVGPARIVHGVDPLAGLKVTHIISGSASAATGRVITYINALQPIENAFDGFVLHARMDSTSRPLVAGVAQPAVVRIRSDLKVPVIVTNNEVEALRGYAARQPEGRLYRLWETAAAPHINVYWNDYFEKVMQRDFTARSPLCQAGNDLPNQAVENAALWWLNRWVRGMGEPPSFAPISISGPPDAIERDSAGVAKGGIRLPQIVVPAARYSTKCPGVVPMTAAEFSNLYPTRNDYLAKFREAVAQGVKAGFLLKPDAEDMLQAVGAGPLQPGRI